MIEPAATYRAEWVVLGGLVSRLGAIVTYPIIYCHLILFYHLNLVCPDPVLRGEATFKVCYISIF